MDIRDQQLHNAEGVEYADLHVHKFTTDDTDLH